MVPGSSGSAGRGSKGFTLQFPNRPNIPPIHVFSSTYLMEDRECLVKKTSSHFHSMRILSSHSLNDTTLGLFP